MRRHIFIMSFTAIGLVLFVTAFFYVRDRESIATQHHFKDLVAGRMATLEREMDATLTALFSLGGLFTNSGDVGWENFRHFSRRLVARHPQIQALEWIPRIEQAERDVFEQRVRKEGFPDFRITERRAQGFVTASRAHEVHFPVYYLEPMAENKAAHGFDLASSPARLRALERSRDSGEQIATARISLVQETVPDFGFLVFQPVYKKAAPVATAPQRRLSLLGFALGVFRVSDIIKDTIDLESGSQRIEVFVFDLSAPAGAQLLYPRGHSATSATDIAGASCLRSPLDVAKRNWLVVTCRPGGPDGTGDDHLGSWIFLVTGLAVIVFFVAYLRATIAQKSATEIAAVNSHLEAIIQNTAEGLVTIDNKGVVASFNPAAEEMFGYAAAEVIGQNVSMLMSPDERAAHDGYVARSEIHAARIINKARDLKGLRKDGSLFPLELNVSPMTRLGQPMFIGIMRDITERKHAELALRETEARFAKSQAFAGIGTWDWNIETGALYWSDHIAVLFGGASGSLETSYDNFVKAIHPDDREKVTGAVTACVEENADYDVEHRVVWLDGTIRWLHERGDTVRNENGVATNMLGVVRDVTVRKEAEANLLQARDIADNANRAKSDFLSSMSHELRTPMNSILGFSQLLEGNPDEPLTEDQQDSVQHIIRSGRHLLELIDDILDLAKIETGKISVSIEPVSVPIVLDECLSIIDGLAKSRGVTISQPETPLAPPKIYADATRFKQVMLNLMTNAIKYNRENGAILIALEQTARETLRISVSDTGNGIADNLTDELFTPFNRLGAENTEIEGTGIGLVICKSLIESMDGTIGMESEVGKGSTFWVELPLASGDQEIALRSAEPDASDAAIATDFLPNGSAKILYVEDNPHNLLLMEKIIARIDGLSLISAHNGEIGIQLAKSENPDLIILDINLPGMDGVEVLGILLRSEITRQTPVVALSAAATQRDIDRGTQAGFKRYMTKPFDINEMIEVIRNELQNSKLEEPD